MAESLSDAQFHESILNGTTWSLGHIEVCLSEDQKRVQTLVDFKASNTYCKKLVTDGEILAGLKASWITNQDTSKTLVALDGITMNPGKDEYCTRLFDVRGSAPPECSQNAIPKCAAMSSDKCLRCAKDHLLVKLNDKDLCVHKDLSGHSVASYTLNGVPICFFMRDGYKFKPENPTRNHIIFSKPCSDITADEAKSISFSVKDGELQNKGETLFSWDDVHGSLRAGADDRWTNKCLVSDGSIRCKGFPLDMSKDGPVSVVDIFEKNVQDHTVMDLKITQL